MVPNTVELHNCRCAVFLKRRDLGKCIFPRIRRKWEPTGQTMRCTRLRGVRCRKILESFVLNSTGSITTQQNDPHQFAFKAKRITTGVVACIACPILSHLDTSYKALKSAFLNFSWAFNTPPRQGLLDKLAATNHPYRITK